MAKRYCENWTKKDLIALIEVLEKENNSFRKDLKVERCKLDILSNELKERGLYTDSIKEQINECLES